jgi:copper chaperone
MNTNNKTLKFKTNINCGGCVAKVTPFLNKAEGVSHWDVDITNKDKILSVHSEGITEEEVIQKVNKAGFKIELLTNKD